MTGAEDAADVADLWAGMEAPEAHKARAVARAKMAVAASCQRGRQRRLLSGRKLKEKLARLRRWRKRRGGFARHAGERTGP